MKNQEEIRKEILKFAETNPKIRAVFLEGSRANPTITPDDFQDYDIVFAVKNWKVFISDDSWTNIFGQKIIEQQPETFSFGEFQPNFFSYLILYKEGFKIDFSIIPIEKIDDFEDSLRIVWLDKDGKFNGTPESSDKDYWVKKPDEKLFKEVCNEFWWVSTYVAKGLARNEIPFAIKYFEEIMRPMLMQMIDWKIGYENDFKVSTGKSGKFYPKYLKSKLYQNFLQTFTDANPQNIWKSLFKMTEIFEEVSAEISEKLKFKILKEEQSNVLKYLQEIHNKYK